MPNLISNGKKTKKIDVDTLFVQRRKEREGEKKQARRTNDEMELK